MCYSFIFTHLKVKKFQVEIHKALWLLSLSSGSEIVAFAEVISTWLFNLESSVVVDEFLLFGGSTLMSKLKKLTMKSTSSPIYNFNWCLYDISHRITLYSNKIRSETTTPQKENRTPPSVHIKKVSQRSTGFMYM